MPKKAVNCRSVWGKVLLGLRNNNIINVHSICIEISDVAIVENDFVINVHKSINYEILKKQQNYGDLVDTFIKLGYNYNVVINFTPDSALPKMDKAKKIAEILGCKVEIKK
ncbi:MAG: hypothetical protein IJ301_05495 [Clostridia bacterium]|nr:hypothetical protein [Clostridia bacterium]